MAGSTQLSAVDGVVCPSIQWDKAPTGSGESSSARIWAAVAVCSAMFNEVNTGAVARTADDECRLVALAVGSMVVVVVVVVLVLVVMVVIGEGDARKAASHSFSKFART